MRFGLAAIVLAGVTGAAQAGDLERADARNYDSSSFAGLAYYRLEFGGPQAALPGAASPSLRQAVGLRVDNERAASWGAPAVFRLQLGAGGLDALAVNGLDLRQVVSLNQGEG